MRTAIIWTVSALALASACGGESEDGGGSNAEARDAGASGASGAAGSGSGGDGGAAGSAASGGAGGAGASGGAVMGTGGAAEDAAPGDPCAAPASAGQTAVCVNIVPEEITFETAPALDGSGVFALQIFDTPQPPDETEAAAALYDETLPANADMGGEIRLADVPNLRAVLDNAPARVYVRAFFADNPAIFSGGELVYGTWIGGVDLSSGFIENLPLEPVDLRLGEGNTVEVPLVALRRLEVTVTRSETPIGDGEGPLTIVAVSSADLGADPASFGFAVEPCADLSAGGSVTVEGVFVGEGPYWVTGVLNDLGTGGDLPAGSLSALDVDLAAGTATVPHRLDVPPGAYSASIGIDLSFLAPLDADAGAPGPNSCADLGVLGDAGLP